MKGSTYQGDPCCRCGGTLRYVANRRCMACRLAMDRARAAERHTLHDDGRRGLASGFVQFATTTCQILRFIHEHRPCLGAEVAAGLGLNRGATQHAIRALVAHGFVFPAGKSHARAGVRSAMMFSTERVRMRDDFQPKTPAQRTAEYRARKRARVASVWDWRGP